MNLLEHFKNYELHANYAAPEDVTFYDESEQPLMEKYSKHYNPSFWDKELFCEALKDEQKPQPIDFEALKAKFNAENVFVSDWESERKERSFADAFDEEGKELSEAVEANGFC